MALVLATLLVLAGCAEIKPYQPPNHREEGTQGGLFTGPQGEWVIYQSDEPADDEKKKKAEQTTDARQPVSDGQQQSKPEAAPDSKQP